MARIRTIKPEFWTDEKIVTLSPLARLLFIGMWNFVDDEGRAEYSPMRLKMQILPADNVDISEILGELRGENMIVVYDVDDKQYFQVCNFSKHQKVDKRTTSKHPPPPSPPESPRVVPTEGIKEGIKEGKGSNPQTPLEGGKKDLQTIEELTTIPGSLLIAGKFPRLDRLPSSSNGREYPPPFLEFWAAWKARPTDTKAGAYKAWRGPVNAGRVDCEILVEAAKVMAGTDPQFIPLVATWINREGWTAEGGNGADKLPGATRDAAGVWRDMAGGAMTEVEVERARELAERVPP
ncbi:hypothetical protein LCGC14_2870930 [marine sediment metagenome]|uniref:Uncharacterized protein n=1 Tax=marine sediment metagenome TaxID=412755 RepID=A0A0F9AU38_9ZZZZ